MVTVTPGRLWWFMIRVWCTKPATLALGVAFGLFVVVSACIDPLSKLKFRGASGMSETVTLSPVPGRQVTLTVKGSSTVLVNPDSTVTRCFVRLFGKLQSRQGLDGIALAPSEVDVWLENLQMTQVSAEQWTSQGSDSTKERSYSMIFECNPSHADLVWLDSVHLATATVRAMSRGLLRNADGLIWIDRIVAEMREIT